MTTRRGFLAEVLATGIAPAFVRASSLSPLWVPRKVVGRESFMICTPRGMVRFYGGRLCDSIVQGRTSYSYTQGGILLPLYADPQPQFGLTGGKLGAGMIDPVS